MEKNVYQKAAEYGLINGYIPANNPIELIDFYKTMAEKAKLEPETKKLVSLFQDAAAIIEIDVQTMEEVVKEYELRNPPRKIEVLGKA